MKLNRKLLLLAAFFVLALPLILTGTASAKYQSDGATPNGTTGGWNAPTDGICVLSIDASGNMVTDPTITTARDCQAKLIDVTAVTTGDTLANVCGTPSKNTAGLKYAAAGSSTCVTIDATGNITGSKSMKDLDRGEIMCNVLGGQLANATPKTLTNGAVITTATKLVANGTAAKCNAYGWQYRGQDATGTPLTFGAKGTTAGPGTGFCYTNMLKTGIALASCPSTSTNSSTAFGYSATTTDCVYAYGIAGDRTSALTRIDGTSYGPTVDMSTLTTMGDCLANGGSWSNWIPSGTAATAPGGTATIMTFDLTRQAVNADEGCLHCHSYTSQANGPAERFKDSYLKTGHKNMLRKVTAGMKMAGPDGVMYDTLGYAAGSINFGTTGNNDATATVAGVAKPLLYLFGDWMAAAPAGLDVVVNMSGAAKYNGGSDYSCAACHTVGWSNTSATAGLCNYSSKTTQATCEAVTSGVFGAGVWRPLSGIQAIGTPGYAATQPGDSFPGITFGAAGQWDLEGIQCGRCHNAAVPNVTDAQIAASAFPQTVALAGGMGNIPSGPSGTWATKLCYSCHQSMAKTSNGIGADADLSHPENIPVKDADSGPGYLPEFNGHVLGGSFLNSVHGKATATVVPNSLGKYDIATATYASTFKGYSCWQSATSSSPAKTTVIAGEVHEIKDKTTCETLYGAGAWRAETQGNCTTCHDVHQSLFVEGQEALRKECESCHENAAYKTAVPAGTQVDTAAMKHPTTGGTPFDTSLYVNACEVCHMPKATSGGFPMHVWRINTSEAYSTFPNATEFVTKKIANTSPDGTYANAVWVDLDLACGQCHGGSAGKSATKNNAPYMDKAYLAMVANKMHLDAEPAPVADGAITVNLVAADGTTPRPLPVGPPVEVAKFILKKASNGKTKQILKMNQTAAFKARKAGSYKVRVYKKGYTFDCDGVLSVNNPVTVDTTTGNQTVNCTYLP